MPVNFAALNRVVMATFREAEPCRYRPFENQTPFDVYGVFDRYQVEVVDPDTGVSSSVRKTVLGCQMVDFPPLFRHHGKDRLTAGGDTFDVIDAQPDGKGWVYLQLGRIVP